ncbi:YARHG domain-containing protein [Sphingobacterium hungaricum]
MYKAVILFILFAPYCQAQSLKDCSSCSTEIIKPAQLIGSSIDEIRMLTNEIFAKNGHQFENPRIQEFFEQDPNYKSLGDNNKVTFNAIEKQNIKFFQETTKSLKATRQELTAQLEKFKCNVLGDELDMLKNSFNFSYEEGEQHYLKDVVSRLDLDDINYYKNTGLQKVLVDNGFVKIVYELRIENNQIHLTYNHMAHSEIIKDFDEFTDYHSENEFTYNWQFEFVNNKLKFVRFVVAG